MKTPVFPKLFSWRTLALRHRIQARGIQNERGGNIEVYSQAYQEEPARIRRKTICRSVPVSVIILPSTA